MRDEINGMLKDDGGTEHTYFGHQHPAGEGFRLLVKMVRLGGGALGRTWGAFSPAQVGEKIQEVVSMLDAGIDGEGIATAIEGLATQILDEPTLVTDLLKHVARDGKALNVDVEFDSAFAGNYGELFSALVWVLKQNYGPFFSQRLGASIGGVGGIVERVKAKAAAMLLMQSKPATLSESTP